jgi:hypothetical protein
MFDEKSPTSPCFQVNAKACVASASRLEGQAI